MKKAKRKQRLKVEKKELDFSIPMMDLGTEGDPCFGKLHSLEASECQECGDQQACQIMMAQRLNKKRIAVSADKNFLDEDEVNVIKLSILEVFIHELLKPDKSISLKNVLVKVDSRFNPDGRIKKEDCLGYIRKAVLQSKRLKAFINEGTGKRYLTIKK